MRWLLSLWMTWRKLEHDGLPTGGPPAPQPEPVETPVAEPRDVGLVVTFSPETSFRSLLANGVYTAAFQHGEVLWFGPNFTIADDPELERFRLTIRTAASWEELAASVQASGDGGEIVSVEQAAPCYEDPSLEPVAPAPAPTETPQVDRGEAGSRSIRVDLERLDHLGNLIGELAVERAHLTDLITKLEVVTTDGSGRRLVQEIRRSLGKLSGTTSHLQEQSTELRMVPVGQLFGRFTRLVRDLTGSTGKKLNLVREGEETTLDKAIVEEMVDPLLHLIRNAADHGIETPEERSRSGKPPTGTITLRAYDQGDQVVIEVADDGKGIDGARVKAKALERGLITPEQAAQMTQAEILRLIFLPGFSTAAQVTDISGRGVGMDVVKTNVERLRGTLDVATEPGKGTRFTISLPLTVSVLQVMLVEAAGQILAVPLTALRGLVRLREESRLLWGQAIEFVGRLVPLVDLAQAWGRQSATDAQYALVMAAGNREIAVLAARPLGQGEVVIKPLGDYVGRLPGIAGAAILADGQVALILDGASLQVDAQFKEGEDSRAHVFG